MPRILVIDDDKTVRATVRTVLEHAGYEVIEAHEGRAGIKAIEASPFDLVIVDVFMPGMDGFETIKLLRALRPQMPVMVVSGFSVTGPAGEATPDFLTMATKLGATASLRKPFRRKELVDAVASCLDQTDLAPADRQARG